MNSPGGWFVVALGCLAFVLFFRGPRPPKPA